MSAECNCGVWDPVSSTACMSRLDNDPAVLQLDGLGKSEFQNYRILNAFKLIEWLFDTEFGKHSQPTK